jgi:hypothetical protein
MFERSLSAAQTRLEDASPAIGPCQRARKLCQQETNTFNLPQLKLVETVALPEQSQYNIKPMPDAVKSQA